MDDVARLMNPLRGFGLRKVPGLLRRDAAETRVELLDLLDLNLAELKQSFTWSL
ncbi:hypothetical protein Tco_0541967, partial [Tanacetum coccineum]